MEGDPLRSLSGLENPKFYFIHSIPMQGEEVAESDARWKHHNLEFPLLAFHVDKIIFNDFCTDAHIGNPLTARSPEKRNHDMA